MLPPMGQAPWRVFNKPMERTAASPARYRRRASYPFQLRDPVSGRKVRARYLAHATEIEGCVAAWEIVAGPRPEPA